MKPHTLKKTMTIPAIRSLIAAIIPLFLTVASYAQADPTRAWSLLKAGSEEKNSSLRLAAVRVLGLIPDDPNAVELAEKALNDPNALVRAAAATALGQMHASGADAALKHSLKDKQLRVVMAAAHSLRLLNDPACYDAYYAILTGERKNDTSMIAQEMTILHDPKQLAEMGFNEGIGYVPFAGMGWEAVQTIMKDRKSGAAAKAALISALATDPDARTGKLLVAASQSDNWVLRVATLEAIAKRGDPSLLPNIKQRVADPKRQVRYTAAAAVIHLTDLANARAITRASVVISAPSAAEGDGEAQTTSTVTQIPK